MMRAWKHHLIAAMVTAVVLSWVRGGTATSVCVARFRRARIGVIGALRDTRRAPFLARPSEPTSPMGIDGTSCG
jgi:hypothetical protein